MKEISLNVENYNEHLFHYPCINPIGKYLGNKFNLSKIAYIMT